MFQKQTSLHCGGVGGGGGGGGKGGPVQQKSTITERSIFGGFHVRLLILVTGVLNQCLIAHVCQLPLLPRHRDGILIKVDVLVRLQHHPPLSPLGAGHGGGRGGDVAHRAGGHGGGCGGG